MNELEQPFFVGHNNPRFPYTRYGYLPALKQPEERSKKEALERGWSSKQWDAVNQLKAGYIHLQKKLNEHVDAGKPKKQKPKGIVPL